MPVDAIQRRPLDQSAAYRLPAFSRPSTACKKRTARSGLRLLRSRNGVVDVVELTDELRGGKREAGALREMRGAPPGSNAAPRRPAGGPARELDELAGCSGSCSARRRCITLQKKIADRS